MNKRNERWFNFEDGRHVVFTVTETGSEIEPTGLVEISYELWADILSTLGFQPEPEVLDEDMGAW